MLRKPFLPVVFVTGIVAFTIAVLAYVYVCAQRRTVPDAGVPDESQIESVHASMAKSMLGFKETPEFTIPPADVPCILMWLRPSTYEKSPPVNPNFIVGTLTINTKQGIMIVVTIYSAGHNPPLFTTNGVDYFLGGGLTSEDGHGVDGGVRMGKAIVQAYEDATQ